MLSVLVKSVSSVCCVPAYAVISETKIAPASSIPALLVRCRASRVYGCFRSEKVGMPLNLLLAARLRVGVISSRLSNRALKFFHSLKYNCPMGRSK